MLKGQVNALFKILIDAFILRELIRRCNYDPFELNKAIEILEDEELRRLMNGKVQGNTSLEAFRKRHEKSGMADIGILPYLDRGGVTVLSSTHINQLLHICYKMQKYQPFTIVPIHDQFSSHPNHMNHIVYWYKELLADLSESSILEFIFDELCGLEEGTKYPKKGKISQEIRSSRYALS